MPKASDTRGILRQNLIDAGCGQEMVRRCMDLAQSRQTEEMKRILARHRQTLLDTLHADEKRIDCLDYLIYKMEKQNKSF